jgi:hypothetical protein
MRRWTQLLAAPLALTVGCAQSTAIIRRPDGPPVEAEIDSSDAATLRLRAPSGKIAPLNQDQVSAIDHPGNVWAAIGAGYAGANLLLFVVPALVAPEPKDGRGEGYPTILYLGLSGAIVGLSIFTYNALVWGRSKARARAFEKARPPDWMIPPAAPGNAQPIEPLPLESAAPDANGVGTHGFHR